MLTDTKRAGMKNLLNEYLHMGGFPEIVLEGDERRKKAIIQDYFRTIIALDICERYKVANSSLMHNYVKMVLSQTVYSSTKTYNTMRSMGMTVGKETLLNYSRYLEDVYLTFFVPIFSPKIKSRLHYPRKVYFVDNSFITGITTKFSKDIGRLMEKLVYLEIIRRYDVNSVFYWKNRNGHEIDFVIVDGTRVIDMIQVCYDISDPDTRKREIRSLLSGAKELGNNGGRMTVITWEYEGVEEVDGNTVEFITLYSWLLG